MRKTLGMTDDQINDVLAYTPEIIQLAVDNHAKETFDQHLAEMRRWRYMKCEQMLKIIDAIFHQELARRIANDAAKV